MNGLCDLVYEAVQIVGFSYGSMDPWERDFLSPPVRLRVAHFALISRYNSAPSQSDGWRD